MDNKIIFVLNILVINQGRLMCANRTVLVRWFLSMQRFPRSIFRAAELSK